MRRAVAPKTIRAGRPHRRNYVTSFRGGIWL